MYNIEISGRNISLFSDTYSILLYLLMFYIYTHITHIIKNNLNIAQIGIKKKKTADIRNILESRI